MSFIAVVVDFSRSFSLENGSFYAGTTAEERRIAAEIVKKAQRTIYACDVHAQNAPEFSSEGGLFPKHHILCADDAALSPSVIPEVAEVVKEKEGRIIVPRHVYFQSGNLRKADFTNEQLEAEFGLKMFDMEKDEFKPGKVEFLVNGKCMYNGASVYECNADCADATLPKGEVNAFSLLKRENYLGEGFTFVVVGCVYSICLLNTAAGIKQQFPRSSVVICSDSATAFPPTEMMKEKGLSWNDMIAPIVGQIGIEVKLSKDVLQMF